MGKQRCFWVYIPVNWAWCSRPTDASTKRYEVRRKGTAAACISCCGDVGRLQLLISDAAKGNGLNMKVHGRNE